MILLKMQKNCFLFCLNPLKIRKIYFVFVKKLTKHKNVNRTKNNFFNKTLNFQGKIKFHKKKIKKALLNY